MKETQASQTQRRYDGALEGLESGPEGVAIAVKTRGGILRFGLNAAERDALVTPVLEDLSHGCGVTLVVEEGGEARRLVGLDPWARPSRTRRGRPARVEQAIEFCCDDVRIVYGYSPEDVRLEGEGGWLKDRESFLAHNKVTVMSAALLVAGRLVDFKQDLCIYESEVNYMDGEGCGGWAGHCGWAVVDRRPVWFSDDGWAFVDAPEDLRRGAPGHGWGPFETSARLFAEWTVSWGSVTADLVEAIEVPSDAAGVRLPTVVPGLRVRVPSLWTNGAPGAT
jgi:hypothetical protein